MPVNWKQIQTVEEASGTYRTINDSHPKSSVYTKTEVDDKTDKDAIRDRLNESGACTINGNLQCHDLEVTDNFYVRNSVSVDKVVKTIDSDDISGSMNLTFSSYVRFRIGIDSTASGDCTLTFTAPNGPCNITLMIVQGASTNFTLTWPANVKWPGGTAPTLSTANNAIDVITLVWDDTGGGDGTYYGQAALNFS